MATGPSLAQNADLNMVIILFVIEPAVAQAHVDIHLLDDPLALASTRSQGSFGSGFFITTSDVVF